jgi:phosphoribosylanthranilate isomerase
MTPELKVKVCGLTRRSDIELIAELGADYFGCIVYPKSPRYLEVDRRAAFFQAAPAGRRVAVDVNPSNEALRTYVEAGFDFFQLHTAIDCPPQQLDQWAHIVGGPDRLWLAPILPPNRDLPDSFVQLGARILLDTYQKNQVGGTGKVNDWERFRRLQRRYSQVDWILAGGLNPQNLAVAIRQAGASHLDVNSGVESAPGIKDPALLRDLFQRVKEVRTARLDETT